MPRWRAACRMGRARHSKYELLPREFFSRQEHSRSRDQEPWCILSCISTTVSRHDGEHRRGLTLDGVSTSLCELAVELEHFGSLDAAVAPFMVIADASIPAIGGACGSIGIPQYDMRVVCS